MTTYSIDIEDDYTPPEGEMSTNEEYLEFVMNRAAESYCNQYGADTCEAGITAAREAYNASLPAPVEAPEE